MSWTSACKPNVTSCPGSVPARRLVETENTDFDRVIELIEKYADLPMDFTDGLLVAICERLEVKHVATVDDDFTIYRYKGRGRFVNLFFE